MGEKLISMSHARLKSLGINVITNTKLQNVKMVMLIYQMEQNKLLFLIFTGGIEASKITDKLDVEKIQGTTSCK